MAEYFQLLELQGLPVNVVQTIGHTQVRELVLGDMDRRPNDEELDRMRGLVREAMEAGAIARKGPPMGSHEGRTYVVTGAASGIGAATVAALAEAGAHIVAADLTWDAAEPAPPEVDRVRLDVADAAAWARLAATR